MITVGLPIYRNDKIAWLSLESLCRQIVNVKWELLIIEEKEPHCFGRTKVMEFSDRLYKAGCIDIVYESLDEWIPLSQKWARMGAMAKGDIFCLQGADDYSHAHKLKNSLRLLKKGDWIQSRKSWYYDINLKKCITYYHPTAKTTANISMLTKYMCKLPIMRTGRGVDSWLFDWCENAKGSPLKVIYDNDHFDGGMHSNGGNYLSVSRYKEFVNPKFPFSKSESLLHKLPKYIAKRLREL